MKIKNTSVLIDATDILVRKNYDLADYVSMIDTYVNDISKQLDKVEEKHHIEGDSIIDNINASLRDIQTLLSDILC